MKHKKPLRPQAPKPKPTVAEREIDIGGQTFDINLILPSNPGSRFWPRCTPLPPETFVPRQFAREIEQHRVNDAEPDEATEPRLLTLSFDPNTMYELSADGRRYAREVMRQTREQMLAQQEADLLHEQLMAERAAYEESEFYQQKMEDDAALREARLKCLNEMHERAEQAREFLAAEERAREAQERAERT